MEWLVGGLGFLEGGLRHVTRRPQVTFIPKVNTNPLDYNTKRNIMYTFTSHSSV